MSMELRIVGEDVLREKALPVEKPFDKLQDFVRNMIDTMYEEKGIGLAAPQVGRSIRLFVYDVGDGPRVCINPELKDFSEETELYEEGCLSVPEINAPVCRPVRLTMRAYGLDGFRFKVEAEEMEARVIQHEYDHLDGVLFIDKIEEEHRTRVEKELKILARKGNRG